MENKKKNIIIIILTIIIMLSILLAIVFWFNNNSEDNKSNNQQNNNTNNTIDNNKIDNTDNNNKNDNTDNKQNNNNNQQNNNINNNDNNKDNKTEPAESVTKNKNIIFFGDSITAGHGSKSKHYSWANYIGTKYDFANYTNAGISDYRVSTYDDENKWLVTQVKNHYNDKYNYNYVIMQGGVNDLIYNTPLGTLANDKNPNSFNKDTFYGGLELYIYNTISKWKNSKIGYIITYYTPNYSERGLKWSYDDYKKYNDALKKTLDKWNIPYLDLFDGSYNNQKYSDILKVTTKEYLPDYLHLNDAGYNLISPMIYEWIKTLNAYS